MKIKLRLKDLREDMDLTQSQLARLLKCSQQTYSIYEAQKTEIPLESLLILAEFYNTSIDYLLGFTDNKNPYPRKL